MAETKINPNQISNLMLTKLQRLAIVNPTIGMQVYQTDTTEGLYIYKSTGWFLLSDNFQPIQYTVTFDVQGGSAIAPILVNSGESISVLPTTVKTDFDFMGWFTGIDGAGTEFTSSSVVTSNITIYAYFIEVAQSIQLTSNVDVYGDSISTNYNGATAWINQLAIDKTLTVTNYAVSGSGVKKALNSSGNSMEENPTKDHLFFTGFNNTRVLSDNGQLNCLVAAYKSMLSYLYMKQIEFPYTLLTGNSINPKYTISGVFGGAANTTLLNAYCSRTLKYRSGSVPGANYYIALNNNTTSYVQCTGLIGDNIVIGTWIGNTNNQTDMEVLIDGVIVMTYNGSNKYTTIAGDGTDVAWVNDAIIIRGLTNTSHTVRVNFKTSGKFGMIDYIGVLKNSTEAVRNAVVLSFPRMNATGYNYPGYQTTQGILDSATLALKSAIQTSFAGYPIRFVDIHQNGLFYDPTANALHIQADGIHPTTLGNTKIKDAVKTILI